MIISDLHLHSRYARACSKAITIENLEKWANVKGLNLLGTGDFQHPIWNRELKNKLEEYNEGIYQTATGFKFLLSTELSNIYTQDGKGRRIHNLILIPSFEIGDQVIEALSKKGRIDYDGRPIFGFSCIELVDIMMNISNDIEIIPAHIWTPWFSIFGSKSGFDSVEECFKEKSKYIHALETGMSSDPEMNERLSKLDNYNLVSFSDAHSFWPWRIGREATLFDTKFSYKDIIKAIRTGSGLSKTIETLPEYGKYHYDGHRKCGISFGPQESLKHNKLCPKCGNILTIGVSNRVEELADREIGFRRENASNFVKLVPLTELISVVYGINLLSSKTIWGVYNELIKHFENELNILLNVERDRLEKVAHKKLVDVIIRNREGKLDIEPGFDGVYGKIAVSENEKINSQTTLKNF